MPPNAPMPAVPGYWMNETSGVLQPVVEKYLAGGELDHAELTIMRQYLRQWMAAPFLGPGARECRVMVDSIETTAQLRQWLARALDAGIDPL